MNQNNRPRTMPGAARATLIIYGLLVLAWPTKCHGQDNPDPHRFDSEIRAFDQWDEKNTPANSPIVFVGSSSIRMWPSARMFPDLHVVNRGFGGSHISDVLYFIDKTVLRYSPKAIVFYAGDNDVADGKSAERVLADFQEFVDRTHSVQPVTTIFYLPIKPSLSRWTLWPEMERANHLVRAACESDKFLVYVDTAGPMIAGGEPLRTLFLDDGLHLNEEGYNLWTDILNTALRTHRIY